MDTLLIRHGSGYKTAQTQKLIERLRTFPGIVEYTPKGSDKRRPGVAATFYHKAQRGYVEASGCHIHQSGYVEVVGCDRIRQILECLAPPPDLQASFLDVLAEVAL